LSAERDAILKRARRLKKASMTLPLPTHANMLPRTQGPDHGSARTCATVPPAQPTWRTPSIACDRQAIPVAIARYVNALDLPRRSSRGSLRGVWLPEFADLDWAGAGLAIEADRPAATTGSALTGAFAIAETGTLVMLAGADSPTATTLLPDTHVAAVGGSHRGRYGRGVRIDSRQRGAVPRAINLPDSRTGVIEQTIVLGAHGPYRVHILVLGASDRRSDGQE
jgi:L-lactate dehydrogenase complex protein LldG